MSTSRNHPPADPRQRPEDDVLSGGDTPHSAGPERDAPDFSAVEEEAMRVASDPILEQMLAEERIESEEVDTKMLLRLAAYLRGHRLLAAVAVGLAFCQALLMTLPAYLIGLTIDSVSEGGGAREAAFDTALASLGARFAEAWMPGAAPGIAMVVWYGAVVLFFWILSWIIAVATTYTVQMLGHRVVHDLRTDVFDHISGMDQTFFLKNPTGRLVNRTTFDIQSIAELFSDAFAQGLRDVLFIAVLIAVMLSMDVALALMLILAFPVLGGIALVYRHFARPAMRTMTAVQSRMNAWLAENLAGMRENHLYGKRLRRETEYRALTEAHQASVTRVIQAWGLLRPFMMMTSSIATAAVILIGYHRVSAGLISVGVLLTFVQYTTRLWVPVRKLTEKFQLIQTALTAGERVMDVLDTPPAMVDRPDADGALRVERGAIRLRDVHFTYPGTSEEVLRGIDVKVPAGSSVALVGNTGAGKSTIISLLSRFYDVSAGAVEVDGHDVRAYLLHHLRSGIALVPQDVVIFAGSLRENINLGRDIPDARIVACLEAVRAGALLRRFERGLDHELEEGGRTLSIGERQLLSFARALVFDPPILILDEATANVDTQTELLIQQALAELTQGRTSVIIAHRLSTIRDCDQILLLRNGRIRERGSHDELMALGGEYHRLVELHLAQES